MKTEIIHDARPELLEASKEIGILVIHGFTGSTQSMRPVAYALHEKGYTVNMPRLKGHGTSPEDMEICTYQDWIDSVSDAYKTLKQIVKKIYVLGLSMGGTLSLYSAIHFEIKGAITINAAVDLPTFKALYEDSKSPRFIQGIGSDIKKEGVTELAYDKTPKRSLGEILQLTSIVKDDLDKITCPIIIFSSQTDHVVPTENQTYIYNHVASKEKQLIILENSYHVATLDNDFDIIIKDTLNFIEKTNKE